MTQFEVVSILKMINELDDKEYMFNMTAFNIAPTIQGSKPSCLLTFDKDNRNLYRTWEIYKNEFLQCFNIEAFHIKDTGHTYTVLFYKRNKLEEMIFNSKNMLFLERFGYNGGMSLEQCFEFLKKRYENSCPHEIGIFLGIPLEDVQAFMEYSNRPCLACGYWKVYYNLHQALETFRSYDDAKIKVLELVKNQLAINNKIMYKN